jgi:hypothetical protein
MRLEGIPIPRGKKRKGGRKIDLASEDKYRQGGKHITTKRSKYQLDFYMIPRTKPRAVWILSRVRKRFPTYLPEGSRSEIITKSQVKN